MELKKIPEEKGFEIIKRFFKVPKQYFCKNEKELEKALRKISFPVYLKATGKKMIHKTESKAVVLAENREEALKAFRRLIKLKTCEKVLVQEKIDGTEIIVGVKLDETFGHVLLLGLGGVFVELFRDVTMRVCPVSKNDVEEMISELKGKKIFEGYRGIKVNKKELIDSLQKLSKATFLKEVKEMDINPLICNEKGCYAVDVRIFKK